LWEWVVGVGEVVEMDSKGRVTIPASIRGALKSRRLLVILKGGVVELRPVMDEKLEALREFSEVKLVGDPRLLRIDASEAKHRAGVRKR